MIIMSRPRDMVRLHNDAESTILSQNEGYSKQIQIVLVIQVSDKKKTEINRRTVNHQIFRNHLNHVRISLSRIELKRTSAIHAL